MNLLKVPSKGVSLRWFDANKSVVAASHNMSALTSVLFKHGLHIFAIKNDAAQQLSKHMKGSFFTELGGGGDGGRKCIPINESRRAAGVHIVMGQP
jgi:hypothetical protein